MNSHPFRSYCVYIVSDALKEVLKVGITGFLGQRVLDLERGKNRCRYLLYWEGFAELPQALAREKELKKMSKRRRYRLITDVNPQWRFLNEAFPGR